SDQLTQDVRQNTAVLVVINLNRRINTKLDWDLFFGPAGAMNDQRDILLGLDPIAQSDDIEGFRAEEVERVRADAFIELKWQHAHSDQVAAMNPLEALSDDRAHAQQARAFRRPIARTARAVFLTGDHDQRRAFGLILHRRVVDAHLLDGAILLAIMLRHAAFRAGNHQ